MRTFGRVACAALAAAIWLAAASVHAQVDAELAASADSAEESEPEAPYEPWFIGGYYRHVWIPEYMGGAFLDAAPSVANHGFGLLLTHRSESGLNLIIGAGYTPYAFNGPVRAAGSDDEDTELAVSDLALLHVTASILWSVIFHEMLALEIGLGLDVGVLTGDITRTEAYPDATGGYSPCSGVLSPGVTNPPNDPNGIPYCDVDETMDPAVEAEHYGVREDRVPPVFGMPMLPHLALRFAPHRYVAVKAEFAFSVVQMFAGASLQIGFGLFTASKKAAEPEVEPVPVGPRLGRVLGQVMEKDTNVPIANAKVQLAGRARSPLSTLDDGRFVAGDLEPGLARFDIEHADYTPASCEVNVTDDGSDSAVHCFLEPIARGGAISGQVKDERGRGIGGARVVLDGPKGMQLTADGEGLFAALDLPPGAYRLQVDSDAHLMQLVEIEVLANETATPTVVLVPRPKQELVEVKASEIVIRQQINFGSGSAEIQSSSQPLMRQLADVFLRNMHIERVEIQGHTDSKGSREMNMQLSQDRADAVREWLIGAGVAPGRLVARGYGPDHALRPNNTPANRSLNRRVQFIIKEQQ